MSDAGFHSSFGYMVKPLYNYKQVKNYIKKLNAIPDYVDQHFVNLRDGLTKGVSELRKRYNYRLAKKAQQLGSEFIPDSAYVKGSIPPGTVTALSERLNKQITGIPPERKLVALRK